MIRNLEFIGFRISQGLLDLVISLILIGFFYLLARVLYKIVSRLVAKTRTSLDDKIVTAFKKPAYYLIVTLGIYLALHRLELGRSLFKVLDTILFIITLLLSGYLLTNVGDVLIRWYMLRVANKTETTINDEFLPLIDKVVKIFIFAIVVIIILGSFGLNINSLIATLGISSLAIALAAQETLANMIAGFIIMLDRPFRIGDRIQLVSGEMGDIVEIGLRSTRILTLDNTVLVVPNSELGKTRIINLSYPDRKIVVKLPVNVAYGSDVSKVKDILLDIAKNHPKVLRQPEPSALFLSLGEYGLNLQLIFWIDNYKEKGIIVDNINTMISQRFFSEGIEIPTLSRIVLAK